MSQFAAGLTPLERRPGDLLRRRPQREEARFDPERARRETRRLQSRLRRLDQQILSERSRARRSDRDPEVGPALERREEIAEELRLLSRATRPERDDVTAEEVMARREDLRQQGLRQASQDLSSAQADLTPEQIERARAGALRSGRAEAAENQAANIPSDSTLPSVVNRRAGEILARAQQAGIADATRRLAAFEGFGLSPAAAAERASRANTEAQRRNAERLEAQAELARRFARQDEREREQEQQAEVVADLLRRRDTEAIEAETRALEQIGQPDQPSPEELAQLRRTEAEIEAIRLANQGQQIENDASRLLLRQGAGPERPADPDLARLRRANEQRAEFNDTAQAVRENAVIALQRLLGGGFETREAETNALQAQEAMAALAELPEEIRTEEARNILAAVGRERSNPVEGTIGQGLQSFIGELIEPDTLIPGRLQLDLVRRREANQAMRESARSIIERLREMAGVAPEPAGDDALSALRIDPSSPAARAARR